MGGTGDIAAGAERITASRLSRHVHRLAADIGERNVFMVNGFTGQVLSLDWLSSPLKRSGLSLSQPW